MNTRFKNRTEAGQRLAERLHNYASRPDVLVLGLPRGGVPVAYEVAKALNAPLDVCLVRKLGVPGKKELAMGAIAPGIRVMNDVVLDLMQVSAADIEAVTAREQAELERRDRLYRGDRPAPQIQNRCVILIDDGMATGSTMRAAIATLLPQKPEYLLVAVPVAPQVTCDELRQQVNEVSCLKTPDDFYAIGAWYDDFEQTSDQEVRDLLQRAAQGPVVAP